MATIFYSHLVVEGMSSYNYAYKGPSGNTSSSFRFIFEKKGGRGLRLAGNTKPEEKLEENRGGLVKLT